MKAVPSYICKDKNYALAEVLSSQKIFESAKRNLKKLLKMYGLQIANPLNC
jgi:hypothetical protein